MPPFHSNTSPPHESGYILTLCMVFVILISLALISLLQTLDHYQRLHTEFQMNAQILAHEAELKKTALEQTEALNIQSPPPAPDPTRAPDFTLQHNEIHLRAILLQNGRRIFIWQGWFFLHDPDLPSTLLFEAKIRCQATSTNCEMLHWQHATETAAV